MNINDENKYEKMNKDKEIKPNIFILSKTPLIQNLYKKKKENI